MELELDCNKRDVMSFPESELSVVQQLQVPAVENIEAYIFTPAIVFAKLQFFSLFG